MAIERIISDLEDVSSCLTNELTDRLIVCLECEFHPCSSCARCDNCNKLGIVDDLRNARNTIDEVIYDLL